VSESAKNRPPEGDGRVGELWAAYHELAEPLTALVAYAEAARRLLDGVAPTSDGGLSELLDKIAAQSTRAAHLLLQLRERLPEDPTAIPPRRSA
jgi:signal transduction histidine kinase